MPSGVLNSSDALMACAGLRGGIRNACSSKATVNTDAITLG